MMSIPTYKTLTDFKEKKVSDDFKDFFADDDKDEGEGSTQNPTPPTPATPTVPATPVTPTTPTTPNDYDKYLDEHKGEDLSTNIKDHGPDRLTDDEISSVRHGSGISFPDVINKLFELGGEPATTGGEKAEYFGLMSLEVLSAGGFGGYFGAGPDHSPFNEGVVDVPKLTLPENLLNKVKTAAISFEKSIENIGTSSGLYIWDAVAQLDIPTSALPVKWGYDIGDRIKGEHLAKLNKKITKFSSQPEWILGGKKRFLQANYLIEYNGSYYYLMPSIDYSQAIVDIVALLSVFAWGHALEITAGGWATITTMLKKVEGKTLLMVGKQLFKAFKKGGVKELLAEIGVIASVGFKKGGISLAVKSVGKRLGETAVSDILQTVSTAMKASLATGWNALQLNFTKGAGFVVRQGAIYTGAYTVGWAMLRQLIVIAGNARGFTFTKEELNDMASWGMASILFAYYGAKIATFVRNNKTLNKSGTFFLKKSNSKYHNIEDFVISELAQFIIFSLGKEEVRTDLSEFFADLNGQLDLASQSVEDTYNTLTKNKGGAVNKYLPKR